MKDSEPKLLSRRQVGVSISETKSGPMAMLVYEEEWRDGRSYYTRVSYGATIYAVKGDVLPSVLEAAVPLVKAIEAACREKEHKE